MNKSSERRQIEKQVLAEMLAERLESGALEHATANIRIEIPATLSAVDEEKEERSDAIHVEFKHGDRIFDQLEIKKSPLGYEINALNTKTGESEQLEVSDNPKIIAEKFTNTLPSSAAFDFNEDDIFIEKLNKQVNKISTANIKVKQMFALEPDSKLNADNLSAKTAVNELQTIKLSESENETKQTAKVIVEKLNNIRNSNAESGKAEIRNAAMVVAALCHNDQALADEIVSAADAESRPYISAIIEQGHDLNTKQLAQTHEVSGLDMEI